MEEQLYPVTKAVLRKPAAESLSEAQEDLEERGLELEVFDGYRPYNVTERMWSPTRTRTSSPTLPKAPGTTVAARWT
jgi:D-alanyl-D-alanine dipeptidase